MDGGHAGVLQHINGHSHTHTHTQPMADASVVVGALRRGEGVSRAAEATRGVGSMGQGVGNGSCISWQTRASSGWDGQYEILLSLVPFFPPARHRTHPVYPASLAHLRTGPQNTSNHESSPLFARSSRHVQRDIALFIAHHLSASAPPIPNTICQPEFHLVMLTSLSLSLSLA